MNELKAPVARSPSLRRMPPRFKAAIGVPTLGWLTLGVLLGGPLQAQLPHDASTSQAVLVPTGASSEPVSGPLITGFERFHAKRSDDELRAGMLLVTELSCTACHRSENVLLAPKRGPDLSGLAARVNLPWTRDFLRNSRQARPGTTMPDLLAGETAEGRAEKVEAIVHFLGSLPERAEHFQLNRPPLEIVHPRFWERGDAMSGQELFHQVGCIACHQPEASFHAKSFETPEAQRQLRELGLDDEEIQELLEDSLPDDAPVVPLPDLHRKYSARSLAFFLLNPLLTRPAGRMPDLHLTPVESADLAAYLRARSMTENGEESSANPPATSLDTLHAPDTLDTLSTISPTLAGEDNGDGRSVPLRLEPALVEQGRRLFQSLGCIECHPLADLESTRSYASWDQVAPRDRGCLAAPPPPGIPDFDLAVSQRTTLLHGLRLLRDLPRPGTQFETNSQTLEERDADDAERELHAATRQLDLTLEQLNCLACHRRDQRGGVGADRWRFFETVDQVDLGDEGRIPPSLDRVGWKLTTPWLEKTLIEGSSVRPHMLARMPRFGSTQVEKLPYLLATVDRPPTTADPEAARDPAMTEPIKPGGDLEAGRLLLDVGCIQCHPLRGEQLPGVRGIDLGTVAGRLRRDWFLHFVKEPAAWKPGTRMPTFFPNGVSNSPDIADGDVTRQLASLWDYLHAMADTPLPDRLAAERLHNFELVPKDKPLVLRTFMDEAGTHAIAVGFPSAISFAFDTWHLRPAIAWKGRFLDAHPIWFDRFTPPTPPLGERILAWAPGPSFAALDTEKSPWPEPTPPSSPRDWQGYQLDQDGVPTFRYRWERYLVQERLAPLTDGTGLERRIEIERSEAADDGGTFRSPARMWFRIHVGKGLRKWARKENNEVSDGIDSRGDAEDVDGAWEEVTDTSGLRIRLRGPLRTEASPRSHATPGGNREQTSVLRSQNSRGENQEWILHLTNWEWAAKWEEKEDLHDPRHRAQQPPKSAARQTTSIRLEYRW